MKIESGISQIKSLNYNTSEKFIEWTSSSQWIDDKEDVLLN